VRRAVFLDRDGVLNRALVRDGVPHPPSALEEVEIVPGVPEALGRLRHLGLALIVVTNQPDVARGVMSRATVEAINGHLLEHLPLSMILTCFHDTPDACSCRKPRPGLLLDGARQHGIALPQSFMIGDRWSDVAAGQAAGCRTFLIEAPYSQRHRCASDCVVPDLAAAVERITDLIQLGPREGATT
jgi:D-glycero-D-manno-heptose 1,7-bisphosphate phosphatase